LKACKKDRASAECNNADRYIIGVVETVLPMVKLSTMEPGILEPKIRPFSGYGVTKIFDPRDHYRSTWYDEDYRSPSQPPALRKLKTKEQGADTHLFMGGFVLNGMGYQLQTYYMEGKKLSAQYALYGASTYEGGLAKDTVMNQIPKWSCQGQKETCQPDDGNATWKHFKKWAEPRPDGLLNVIMDWNCGAPLPSNMMGFSWKLRLHAAFMVRVFANKLGWKPRFIEDSAKEFYVPDPYQECDKEALREVGLGHLVD
jgi:hypothetical protein